MSVLNHTITTEWIAGTKNPADMLTKALNGNLLQKLRLTSGIESSLATQGSLAGCKPDVIVRCDRPTTVKGALSADPDANRMRYFAFQC